MGRSGNFPGRAGKPRSHTLQIAGSDSSPELRRSCGHRKDRSVIQRRSLLAAPEICSAATRTPIVPPSVWPCRVGRRERPSSSGPKTSRTPLPLGLQAPPALAQDIHPPLRRCKLRAIVDVTAMIYPAGPGATPASWSNCRPQVRAPELKPR